MKLRTDAEATLVPAEEVAKKAADIVREELKKLNA
jgi:prolyl-tRNA synthetase